MSSGGVIETSPSDLTLYNLGVAIHLLGGALPHDELLARDHSVVSSHSLWSVNVQVAGLWTPMVPASNNFTILGTNSSGTFVIRTMKVDSGVYSGTLRVTYRATSEGSLKWDLAFDAATSGHYKLVYDLWNLTSSIDHTAGRILSANLGRENYTLEWGDVPRSLNTTTSVSIGRFSLHIDLGRVMTGSTARVDPGIVGSSSSSEATGFSFQRKVFYEPKGGYYFAFYYDGYEMRSSNSSDGVNWSQPYSLPPGLIQYGLDESYLVNVFSIGQTVIVTAGRIRPLLGILPGHFTTDIFLNYTIGNVTGPRINWGKVLTAADTGQFLCPTNSPTACMAQVQLRFVSVGVSSTGQLFFL